jgi:aminopeptidase N
MRMKIFLCTFSLFLLASLTAVAQPEPLYTKYDTLMGSNTPQRSWWDVQRYDIHVSPDYATKTIRGKVTITYTVVAEKHSEYLQVDLQKPMEIDSLYYNGKMYINHPSKPYYNDGNHWFIPLPKTPKGSSQSVTIVYHGKPREAKNPPWDGGWIWKKDKQGRPWMSVACQGDGASLWYPCKDYWGDEPDSGASLTIQVPDTLVAVGNGRLTDKVVHNGKASFRWEVTNPINTYNIVPYIGSYTSWSDTLAGEKGKLDLTYWVLDYEVAKAKAQFEQVKPMLHAFEHWLGPYPFYEDGYQLVQSPYLGMEHQSAVAYGNGFTNGYLGSDLSGTGWGLKWDYIIVHETGHEWFGNNITAKDRADMWIQEGFTDYSETLYTEYFFGKQAGNEYTQGLRKNISNNAPIIAHYGVNKEGSGDMYFKGSNMLHTIRQIIGDDEKFRQILRGLGKDFYHQTITSKQVENYISLKSGKDLSTVFDQYLRTTKIPVLEYKAAAGKVQFRWTNTVNGFNMPVKLTNGQWIIPGTEWQTVSLPQGQPFAVDKNFYITLKKL